MKEKLNTMQLTIFIYMIQSGVIIFSLPRLAAEGYGTNGWICVPLFSFIVMANLLLIYGVYRLGKGQSIFVILEERLPQKLLFPVYSVLAAFWAVLGAIVAKQYVMMLKSTSLPKTSTTLLLLFIIALSVHLLSKGIYSIVKAGSLFFFLSIWTVLLWMFNLFEIDLIRLTPFIFKGGHDTFQRSLQIYSAFLGYELCMFFFPYVDRKQKLFRAFFAGNLITTFIYTSVSFISFGFFSLHQVLSLSYPTIYLFGYLQSPFLERVDILLFSFFFPKTLITIVMYYWAAQETLRRMLPGQKPNVLAIGIAVASLAVSFIPSIMREVLDWLSLLSNIETLISFGLPLLLIALLVLRKKQVKA
ncbi:GerAB/ArcD/ProY family transporter [Paenibacillus sp. MBLB4367]|uniref:GerAB/ArcD/ProY family transporter n=1 Tax=Paenibacillus sp. MBLB4367 TaxID=3384767 RepID=UPI0039081645